jgi:uncharacterized Zn finger protein (UPF0148 family)
VRQTRYIRQEKLEMEQRFEPLRHGWHMFDEFTCRNCGAPSVQLTYTRQGGPRPKYCSSRCRSAWHKSPPHAITCATCGDTFTPKRSDARTCSVACRVALHRASALSSGF